MPPQPLLPCLAQQSAQPGHPWWSKACRRAKHGHGKALWQFLVDGFLFFVLGLQLLFFKIPFPEPEGMLYLVFLLP